MQHCITHCSNKTSVIQRRFGSDISARNPTSPLPFILGDFFNIVQFKKDNGLRRHWTYANKRQPWISWNSSCTGILIIITGIYYNKYEMLAHLCMIPGCIRSSSRKPYDFYLQIILYFFNIIYFHVHNSLDYCCIVCLVFF